MWDTLGKGILLAGGAGLIAGALVATPISLESDSAWIAASTALAKDGNNGRGGTQGNAGGRGAENGNGGNTASANGGNEGATPGSQANEQAVEKQSVNAKLGNLNAAGSEGLPHAADTSNVGKINAYKDDRIAANEAQAAADADLVNTGLQDAADAADAQADAALEEAAKKEVTDEVETEVDSRLGI